MFCRLLEDECIQNTKHAKFSLHFKSLKIHKITTLLNNPIHADYNLINNKLHFNGNAISKGNKKSNTRL